ncbi:MAG TPA: alpha/beta hydrolase-fold protein [Bryobacterales bacterium]|nr:alpha/beta hydrolase-fold protein [Bryobacterales bacterium]
MKTGLALFLAGISLAIAAVAAEPYKPTDAEKQQIRARLADLDRTLEVARNREPDDALLADAEVYRKAAQWILRFPEEFYTPAYVANTLAALDRGLARAKLLAAGQSPWAKQKGRLVRAYRSRVDGSVQPYGLVIPDSYDGSRPVRLDLVMHGKGATLNEVSFLAAHDSEQPVPPGQDFLQLDVFGRTNNAYRWAGETDVFEALESVRRRYNIDPRRIVLRGFSMGGAGAWHLGLHYPGLWAAVEAGAGFTETKRYAKPQGLPPELTPYQEAALHIYDAVDYALNAFNLPMVGYGGEIDPQLQASVNIREQLAREDLPLADLRVLFLVGPHTPHRFHPDSKRESEEFIRRMLPQQTPDRLRFVTYTTRHNRCFWITVEGLERQYERAEVDAQRDSDGRHVTITTRNVSRLTLAHPAKVTLDGQPIAAGPLLFEKQGGQWKAASSTAGLRKQHGLQGPIDDAFMEPFLCVRPTGKPWHPLANDYAQQTLDRFSQEFAKWLRGDVRVKDDTAVTPEDISNYNLVLFGDPGSNRLIGRIAGRLPIRWTRRSVVIAGQTFPAADHLPALIYPNPLNPKRYVVLNSGHTFHEKEFRGTNALLFPRLGDYAVIDAKSGEAALAGLFGVRWDLPKAPPPSAAPTGR